MGKALQRCAVLGLLVVVLDLSLPKMDGLAALHLLRGRKKTSAIPVVILPASVGGDVRAQGSHSADAADAGAVGRAKGSTRATVALSSHWSEDEDSAAPRMVTDEEVTSREYEISKSSIRVGSWNGEATRGNGTAVVRPSPRMGDWRRRLRVEELQHRQIHQLRPPHESPVAGVRHDHELRPGDGLRDVQRHLHRIEVVIAHDDEGRAADDGEPVTLVSVDFVKK